MDLLWRLCNQCECFYSFKCRFELKYRDRTYWKRY